MRILDISPIELEKMERKGMFDATNISFIVSTVISLSGSTKNILS